MSAWAMRRGRPTLAAIRVAIARAIVPAMSNVLIRGVPEEDLELIRAAAADRGTSLQSYLLQTVQAQALYLRRQEALARTARRLQGKSEVSDVERDAVLDAVDAAHEDRATQLGQAPQR